MPENIRRDFEKLKKEKSFKRTNYAWNCTGINSVSNIGSLMGMIQRLKPQSYEEWEKWFKENVADNSVIHHYAMIFKSEVVSLFYGDARDEYKEMPVEKYIQMVECRLIYETWLGYMAEAFVKSFVADKLNENSPNAWDILPMSPEDDNRYSVDGIVTRCGVKICGIQIKPTRYKDADTPNLLRVKKQNLRKNKVFEEKYQIPVLYVYYRRDNGGQIDVVDDGTIEAIRKI